MGMNHAGEIRALAEIAKPNVGVVTNVGWAHMESFDSIDGIAAAKRELIEALPPDGTAVLNADDPRVAAFASSHKGRVVTFGESEKATVRAEDVKFSEDGLTFRVGATRFESPLTGRHSVSNLLAGIAVAGIYGITPDRLTDRVRNIQPGKMRGERLQHRGILVFNDCYNSNPDAARAMLAVLRDTPARRRIAVLGEMLELGRWAEPLHRDVGNYAAECGIDVLVGLRGAACYMLDAAKRSGLRADAAFFFDDPVPAGQLVRSLAQPGDAVLFKGSRGVHVERALEQFLASPGRGQKLTHVLLARIRTPVPLFFAVSNLSVRDVSYGHGESDRRDDFRAVRSVVHRTFAQIPDRPAHSGRRAAISPQKSRDSDHGRLADLRRDRDFDAAVGQPATCPRCGSPWPGWSRSEPSDSGTITPKSSASAIWGSPRARSSRWKRSRPSWWECCFWG